MTFREKLQAEHPEKVGELFIGGCSLCPCDYGYEEKSLICDEKCFDCWNREIPTTKAEETPTIPVEEVDMSIVVDKYHEGYDKGLADAWELAKKFWYLGNRECKKIFGFEFSIDILEHFTPQEALAKLKAYEDRKIEVGDVVEIKDDFDKKFFGVVVSVEEDNRAKGFLKDGRYFNSPYGMYKKTGKHIDIQSILEQIGGK